MGEESKNKYDNNKIYLLKICLAAVVLTFSQIRTKQIHQHETKIYQYNDNNEIKMNPQFGMVKNKQKKQI